MATADAAAPAPIHPDDAEVFEFFDHMKKKGVNLSGFAREYSELRAGVENVTDDVIDKEREVKTVVSELNQIREQSSISTKIAEDTVSQREAIAANLENLHQTRKRLFERESLNRVSMQQVSSHFPALQSALSVGAGWTPAQEEERKMLEKERDYILTKVEAKSNLVAGIRMDVDGLYEAVATAETDLTGVDKETEDVKAAILEQTKSAETESTRGKKLGERVLELKHLIGVTEEEHREKMLTVRTEDQSVGKLESSLAAAKDRMDEYIREYDALVRSASQHTYDLNKCIENNRTHEVEIEERNKSIASRKKELDFVSKEYNSLRKLKDLADRKIAEIEEEHGTLEGRKEDLQRNIAQLKDVEAMDMRRECEGLSKHESSLLREIGVVKKKVVGSENIAKSVGDLIFVNQGALRNLAQEKRILQTDVQLQQDKIQHLIQEKDKYEHETEVTNQQYYTSLEELKLQELQSRELQKKISEDQAKLKQKQNLYEAVRSDRNLYSKQLSESQENIGILKRKFRMMNHQIDQLKEEISSKDHSIVKEHFHHHAVDKERELLKNELTKIRKQLLTSVQIIENQHIEILKLSRIIEEADEERQRQSNELVAIIAERNLLTAQLVRRNGELTEMYSKIKIQRSNLRIGEQHYDKVMRGIGKLQTELVEMVETQNATIHRLGPLEEYKSKVIKLDRDILHEQTKSRALYDEQSRPMNVHRWRVLESSDPKRFEKIRQIQVLQKELIAKSDGVVEKDLLIQEKEKVYIELKGIISRQPGPEVEEQLLVYQQTLKDKGKQYASMNDELEMYRMQVSTFKEGISRIDADVGTMKKKYFKMRKAYETKQLMNSTN
jgi:chromosome segregation ATPase